MDERKNELKITRPLSNNWLSMFGFLLAMAFLIGEAIIITADLAYGSENPYTGILIYIVGPSILVTGLLMVPLGMAWEHRRRIRGKPVKELPVFDLNTARHRIYLGIFTVVTTIFLSLSMIGSYKAYQVTESVQFCGLVCHQVMKPEYTAYQYSPHARVACVECHIGPGADWFVKSKLSGAWQVYAVLTKSYKLPIDTPVENLRPARDTCEQCHWPEKFYRAVEKSLVFYGGDEENTPYRVDMLLNVGGQSDTEASTRGIHWHIGLDHKLEYYPADQERQSIPWVRVTYDDGTSETFIDSATPDFNPDAIDPQKIRVMDCIDCHNRPSHRYLSPFRAVNETMQRGLIDPKLPEIKSKLVELLQTDYPSTDEALKTIQDSLREDYAELVRTSPDMQASVDQAVLQGSHIFSRNIFPEMKVNWQHYPWNIGHYEFPGCYRCHDDNHKSTSSEKVIRNDCNLCHTIIRQAEGWDAIANPEYKQQKFDHPRGFGDAWEGQNCHECHGPGLM